MTFGPYWGDFMGAETLGELQSILPRKSMDIGSTSGTIFETVLYYNPYVHPRWSPGKPNVDSSSYKR